MLGICVAAVSLFYFFYVEKAEAEKRMVEIVNYVKVQCSTYTHYNESSESKSLLRAIESARQMSTNINMETENGRQLSRDFLKENLQTLWVRLRGWQVPAFTLGGEATDIVVMRIMCRRGFEMDFAELLLEDYKASLKYLSDHPKLQGIAQQNSFKHT